MHGSTFHVGVGKEIEHISAVLKSLLNENLLPDFSGKFVAWLFWNSFLLKPCSHPTEEADYVMFQL